MQRTNHGAFGTVGSKWATPSKHWYWTNRLLYHFKWRSLPSIDLLGVLGEHDVELLNSFASPFQISMPAKTMLSMFCVDGHRRVSALKAMVLPSNRKGNKDRRGTSPPFRSIFQMKILFLCVLVFKIFNRPCFALLVVHKHGKASTLVSARGDHVVLSFGAHVHIGSLCRKFAGRKQAKWE